MDWTQEERCCETDGARPCPINQIQFGRLINSVENMATTINALSDDVKSLTEFKNNGKGILIGVALAAGGVGAFIGKVSAWVLR